MLKTKKSSAIGVTLVIALGLILPALAYSAAAAPNNNPNKLWGAPCYVLNILGKKSDYNGNPSYESMDRHTMFVPENVDEFLGATGFPDAKIWVSQDTEFAVNDPNMFDDGQCNLTLASGKYAVYFAALGKKNMEANLEGWIYNASAAEYLLYVGSVTVKHSKQPVWVSGEDMMTVSEAEAGPILDALGTTWEDLLALLGYPSDATEIWIFDFVDFLGVQTGYDYLYLWKLVSGCKHIQVRFYKMN
jgi:hypothetical protein